MTKFEPLLEQSVYTKSKQILMQMVRIFIVPLQYSLTKFTIEIKLKQHPMN